MSVGPFDRVELARVLVQALDEFGCPHAARTLAAEANVVPEDAHLAELRAAAQCGDFARAEAALDAAAASGVLQGRTASQQDIYTTLRMRLREQQYIELLVQRDLPGALACLRTRIAPLGGDPAHLQALAGKGKKESLFRARVVCCVMSHAVCWASTPVRLMLLEALADVRAAAKLEVGAPLIEDALAHLHTGDMWSAYYAHLARLFDASAAPLLDDERYWRLFVRALAEPQWQAPLTHVLHSSLYAALPPARRQDAYLALARILASDVARAAPEASTCLRALPVLDSVRVSVLRTLLEALSTSDEPAAKRSRGPSDDDSMRSAGIVLITVLESMQGAALGASAPLVAALVDSQAFALDASLRALVAPAYHVPLLHMVLVVMQAARGARAPPAPALALLASAALRALTDLDWCAAALAQPTSDAALEAEHVLDLLAAIVAHAVHPAMPLDPGTWLVPLRETHMLAGVLDLVTCAPRVPAHVRGLAPLLALCDALAARAESAPLLARAGALSALCDHALTPLLDAGHVDAVLASGDANPLHALWLRELHIAVRLVENARASADVFVGMYAAQVRHTLEFAPLRPRAARTLPLDVALLAEVAAVLRLFRAMWRAARAPPARPGVPARDAARALPLGTELIDRAPHLLFQLAYLQHHPHELRALLGAADLPDADARTLCDAARASLSDALGTLLALLCDICAAPAVLTAGVDEWPALPAPIHPSLHSAQGGAAVGTLLELAASLTDARAGDALEQCLVLCVTQAALWAHVPPPADARALADTAHAEIDAGLARDIDAALAGARAAVASPLWEPLRAFARRSLIYP